MTLIKSGARSARALLDTLLDRPSPLSLVQSLSPGSVASLIERVGLEDLGDLLTLLSPEQLTDVFDRDLWRSARPGQDEAFDAERFARWLELWVEHDPCLAAKKLAEMDFELVALGISKQVLVLDMEQLAQMMLRGAYSDDDEQLEKALESNPYHEFEHFRVLARDTQCFDTLVALLVELNTHDYSFLCELLERCCALASEYIADNGGLYEVLSAAEMCEIDVAVAREERREAQGYVPASSALAFLRLASDTSWEELWQSDAPDPITRAHLRAAARATSADFSHASTPAARSPSTKAAVPLAVRPSSADANAARLMSALELLLQEEPAAAPALPKGRARASLLARALVALCEKDELGYERCLLEASYLANVVLAAVGTHELRFEPSAAAEVAFAVCELGAEESARAAWGSPAQRVNALAQRLVQSGLVKLFQLGFHRMCEEQTPTFAGKRPTLSRLRTMLEAQGLVHGVIGPSRRAQN
jgi:hypothetical protein